MKNLVFIIFLFSKSLLADSSNPHLPYAFESLGDYPSSLSADWTETAQGVAHDDLNWYFSSEKKLLQVPKNANLKNKKLSKASGVKIFRIPQYLLKKGYNHMGDIDHYNGHIYVPLEGPAPQILLKVRASDLTLVGTAVIQKKYQLMFPWLAVDPRTGYIYTSGFNIDPNAPINVFRENPNDPNFSLEFVKSIRLKNASGNLFDVKHVQGGAFAGAFNQLLLASDTVLGGIYTFDLNQDALLVGHVRVSYSPGFPDYEEIEGIDYWPYSEHESENFRGNVHLIMLDNDLSNDDVYFKHFRLNQK